MKHMSPSSVDHPLLTTTSASILRIMHSQYNMTCPCMALINTNTTTNTNITNNTHYNPTLTGGHPTPSPNPKTTIQIIYHNILNSTNSRHSGSHIHIQLHTSLTCLHTTILTMHTTPVPTPSHLP